MTGDRARVTGDRWHMTRDRRQVTADSGTHWWPVAVGGGGSGARQAAKVAVRARTTVPIATSNLAYDRTISSAIRQFKIDGRSPSSD